LFTKLDAASASWFEKYHRIVWHFDNAKIVNCLFSRCFQSHKPKIII